MATTRFERACEDYSAIRRPFYAHKLLRYYEDNTPTMTTTTIGAGGGNLSEAPSMYPTYEDEKAVLKSHMYSSHHHEQVEPGSRMGAPLDKRWAHLPCTYGEIISKHFGEVSATADCAKLLAFLFERYDLVPKLFTTPFEAATAAAVAPLPKNPDPAGPSPDLLVNSEGGSPSVTSTPARHPHKALPLDSSLKSAQAVFASIRTMRDVVAGRRTLLRGHQAYMLMDNTLDTTIATSRVATPAAGGKPPTSSRAATTTPGGIDASFVQRSGGAQQLSSGGRLIAKPSAVVDLTAVDDEDLVLEQSSHHVGGPSSYETSQRAATASGTPSSNGGRLTADQMRRFNRLVKGGHLVAAGAVIKATDASATSTSQPATSTANPSTAPVDAMSTYLDTRARTPWASADQGTDTRRPLTSYPLRKGKRKAAGGASTQVGTGRPLSPLKLADTGELINNTSSNPLHHSKMANTRPATDFVTFARQSQSKPL